MLVELKNSCTEYFNTVYHVYMLDVPGTFFNATHQVKAIAIGVSEANPLVELTDCSNSVHLHVFFPLKRVSNLKELSPNTYFNMALYSRFCLFMGITFTRPVFLFEINHDDGTASTDYTT